MAPGLLRDSQSDGLFLQPCPAAVDKERRNAEEERMNKMTNIKMSFMGKHAFQHGSYTFSEDQLVLGSFSVKESCLQSRCGPRVHRSQVLCRQGLPGWADRGLGGADPGTLRVPRKNYVSISSHAHQISLFGQNH